MKKVINMLAAFLLMSGFLMPGNISAAAELDQYQTDHNSWNYISGHQYVGQTFKPNKNRLNKISLKIRGAGDVVMIQMTKNVNDTLLLPGTPMLATAVDADFKWYDFTFSDVAVSTGESYVIWVAALGNSRWGIHNTSDELYSNGRAYKDCVTWVTTPSCVHSTVTADWTFKTFGYSTEVPPAPAAPPAPPPAAVTSEKPKAEETAALSPPVLTSLSKNETNVDLPVNGTVTISQAGTLNLAGTAAVDAEVNVVLGDKSFSAAADKDGKWKLAVKLDEVKIGEYTVKSKTVKDDRASAEAEFFKVKVEKANIVDANMVNAAGWFAGWNIFYVLIPVGILLLVLLLLAIIARRHHHEKKIGDKEEKTDNEGTDEKETEEEKPEPKVIKRTKKM